MNKLLVVKLDPNDLAYAVHVLGEIARKLEDGYTSGMSAPVDWWIETVKDHNDKLKSVQDQVRDLRDSEDHVCSANDDITHACSCGKYDAIIDSLENKMLNE